MAGDRHSSPKKPRPIGVGRKWIVLRDPGQGTRRKWPVAVLRQGVQFVPREEPDAARGVARGVRYTQEGS